MLADHGGPTRLHASSWLKSRPSPPAYNPAPHLTHSGGAGKAPEVSVRLEREIWASRVTHRLTKEGFNSNTGWLVSWWPLAVSDVPHSLPSMRAVRHMGVYLISQTPKAANFNFHGGRTRATFAQRRVL